jgi:hypothetical protein
MAAMLVSLTMDANEKSFVHGTPWDTMATMTSCETQELIDYVRCKILQYGAIL